MTSRSLSVDHLDPRELQRQLLAADRLLRAKEAADSYHEFVQFMHPDPLQPDNPRATKYQMKPHHRLFGDIFEEVLAGKLLKVMISIPPQHGKSEAAKSFLGYHQGKFPFRHIVMGTYNDVFANEYGDDTRAIFNSENYKLTFPRFALRKGAKAKDHMVTEDGGKLSFVGRGSGATGRPADGLLVDDPFKDDMEASSFTIREQVWQWWTKVLNARCHALAWQIIIMTRWSEDDLVGRLTDRSNTHYSESVARQWTVINIPAIVDEPKIAKALGLEVGAALWEERFPLPHLKTAREMNPSGFDSLYMGRPTPPEGAFFKIGDLHGYGSIDEFPKEPRYYVSGDLGVPDKKLIGKRKYDKACCGLWGIDEFDNAFLHPDLIWDVIAIDDVIEQLLAWHKTYHFYTFFGEKGQIKNAMEPFLVKRQMEESQVFNIESFPTTGNKGARAMPARSRMRQRKIFLPTFAPWWPRFKDVLLKFTGSGEDPEDDPADMIGLFGQGLLQIVRGNKTAEQSNVVAPKPGTIAYFRWVREYEKKRTRKHKNIAGW